MKPNEELILERPRSRGLIECEKCGEMISKKQLPDHMMAHDLEEGRELKPPEQSPIEVKNNIILDIDDILKKEEAIQQKLSNL